MKIGLRIKQRRKELQWSQRDLAEKMGYNHSTITRIETGKIDIPQSRIVQFSEVLGVTTAYLMGWDDKQPTDDGELSEDLMKISALISELDDSRLGAALEIAQKISTLSEAEVAALLAVVRSMGGK